MTKNFKQLDNNHPKLSMLRVFKNILVFGSILTRSPLYNVHSLASISSFRARFQMEWNLSMIVASSFSGGFNSYPFFGGKKTGIFMEQQPHSPKQEIEKVIVPKQWLRRDDRYPIFMRQMQISFSHYFLQRFLFSASDVPLRYHFFRSAPF